MVIFVAERQEIDKMGWWKLEAWKLDSKGEETDELSDADLEHIAENIKEGYTSGEINDDEENAND